MTDNEREHLRAELDQAMAPAVAQVIAEATRPWKRFTFWLLLGYGVMCALSIVQAVLWFQR